MIDPDALNVWYGERLLGYLRCNADGRMGFQYDAAWLEDGFRLSVRLPLQAEPFPPEGRSAHAFFANLLPEGGARERLVRSRRLSDNDFLLLREFGGDCAGALSLLPVEADPATAGAYAPLSSTELHQLVLQHGRAAYAPRHGGPQPRLSLAGAQDKCPIFRSADGHYALPTGTAASSHILKFRVDEFANVPLYEAFMNRLAQRVGVPTPETHLEQSEEETFLVIQRFDRTWQDGTLRRLHQEDFLQALGPERFRGKYEAEGGPGFPECAGLLREVSEDPITDLRNLLRWQIFNTLAGNSDGHAKNLALIQVVPGSNRWRLAPFYDLVCTRAIDGVDTRLAMSIGGEWEPEQVTAEHWHALARASGLRPRLVDELRAEMTAQLPTACAATRAEFETAYGPLPALQRIEDLLPPAAPDPGQDA